MDWFGDFHPLFKDDPTGAPAYLALLNAGDHAGFAIAQIRMAIAASGDDFGPLVVQLLGYPNWRPQLVAACAMLIARCSDKLPNLWAALDRPCWTSPQLATVASRLDPGFVKLAKARLEKGCPVEPHRDFSLPPAQRDLIADPTDLAGHSNKLTAAMLALCAEEDSARDWLPGIIARPYIQRALERDPDDGGAIALRWRSAMDRLLRNS